MLGSVLTLLFFVAVAVAWRFLKPAGIGADSLRQGLLTLLHMLFLPLAVFFIMLDLPLNEAALRIMLYVLGTTLLALALAWGWLWKMKMSGKTKGALLIGSAFGSLFFIGVPLNAIFYPDWTMRVAVEYGLVANVLLLFTAGAVLSKSFSESGKAQFGKAVVALKDYQLWLKEPMVWAALLALVLNMAEVALPDWLKGIRSATLGALVPLLLITAALALNWSQEWQKQVVGVLPAVAIQLIAVPLLMWGMVSIFGSPGVKTTQVLLLDSMLPAAFLGLLFCERFKLDTASYTLVFTLTVALSLLTVPVWVQILL